MSLRTRLSQVFQRITLAARFRSHIPLLLWRRMPGEWMADIGLQDRVVREQGVTGDDIFLASYPRSGNSWLRHLISCYLQELNGIDTRNGPVIPLRHAIPDMHMDRVNEIDSRIAPRSRIIKSHYVFTPVCSGKLIYLFRAPNDTLSSFYYYHLRKKESAAAIAGMNIDEFCLAALPIWVLHVLTSINYANTGSALFISYERLYADTLGTLMKVLEFAGMQPDLELCRKSVASSEFGVLQAREKKTVSAKTNNHLFYRKGAVGTGKRELRDETNATLSILAEPVYQKAVSLQE